MTIRNPNRRLRNASKARRIFIALWSSCRTALWSENTTVYLTETRRRCSNAMFLRPDMMHNHMGLHKSNMFRAKITTLSLHGLEYNDDVHVIRPHRKERSIDIQCCCLVSFPTSAQEWFYSVVRCHYRLHIPYIYDAFFRGLLKLQLAVLQIKCRLDWQ